jgi:large subunit ribosomal protein L13
MQKTFHQKQETRVRKWYLIDCEDKILGRLATFAAKILKGKHRQDYTANIYENLDCVILVNAEKIKVSGNKANYKLYRHYTGYMGGLKSEVYKDLQDRKPEEILKLAIVRMISQDTPQRRQIEKNLYVYAGPEHKHEAQSKDIIKIDNIDSDFYIPVPSSFNFVIEKEVS